MSVCCGRKAVAAGAIRGIRRRIGAAGESRGSEFESIKMITSEAAADGRLSLPPCHRLV
jgi:hypothetical protein